jgi:signal peptide peptidase SppA
MLKYMHILIEAATSPWAMEAAKLRAMIDIFRFQALGGKLSAEEIDRNIDAARIHPNTDRSVANKPGNVGVMHLRGVISNRAPLVEDVSSERGTSVERFTQAFRSLRDSDQVKAIVFDCNSPGGTVYGVRELAEEIRAARGTKPLVAQVNATCASAAYWIASACDEIVVTPSGQVGSIGVYTIHEEISKFLAEQGITETIISAGKYKTEANPFEPLGDEARAAMQATIDRYYGMFVDAVAENRGAKPADVRNGYGQGRMVIADEAIEAGLADRIGTMAETLARFGVDVGGDPAKKNARAEAPHREHARRRLELNT